MSEATLFVRKASGLVRSWSGFDAFIYATFSINLITLGLFIFSYCWYFGGNLGTAVVIGGAFTIFEVILYASLISAMPRAGGDYVWQSRILGRGVGFLLTVTGWWFILWLWVPLYGQMLAYEVLTPLAATLGLQQAALWFTTYPWGPLTSMLLVCLIVFVYIAIGMKAYARVQKLSFWVGMAGLLVVFGLLLFGNRESFIAGLNANLPALYGVPPGDYYTATLEAGQAAGVTFGGLGDLSGAAIIGSFALIPMIVFFNLWPNWGSTLYGEVRGASDYKKNFWGMASAVIVTAGLALVFFALINKTIGWDFFMNANGAFWSSIFYGTEVAIPVWPYPVQFATFLTSSRALQFLVILAVSFWWFGWSGTVFLSSTRVIFAAALDRMLPEWVSKIEPRTKTPVNALLLMVIPSVIVSVLYAFNIVSMQSIVLDATLVIAITFFGTALAGILLPWRQKSIFDGSPIAKFKMPGWLSWLLGLAYVAGAAFLIYRMYTYAFTGTADLTAVFTQWADQDARTQAMILVVAALSLVNVALLVWVALFTLRKLLAGEALPLVTVTGLVFFAFLDWLLVEWFWDPGYLYGIGWQNSTSMLYMIFNYALAAAIFYGFSAYRKRQGIDVDKVYKEIPVE
ncbi:MAG TPA: amino acid permease [Anaerolineales bacterium]|nr:amino acid permease [Anaerolineales bacterium]